MYCKKSINSYNKVYVSKHIDEQSLQYISFMQINTISSISVKLTEVKMKKKITHIPTLQSYTKLRKKARNSEINCSNCNECSHFRKELNVCIFGNNVRAMEEQTFCPMSYQQL